MTGKSNRGKSMYRKRFSDFSASAYSWFYQQEPTMKQKEATHCVNFLHLSKCHLIQPVRFREVPSFVLLHQLKKEILGCSRQYDQANSPFPDVPSRLLSPTCSVWSNQGTHRPQHQATAPVGACLGVKSYRMVKPIETP